MTVAAARFAATLHPLMPPQYVDAVWQDTWGHLQPQARAIYTGHVLFGIGCHRDHMLIDWAFALADGTQLDSSPWFYEDINTQVSDWIETRAGDLDYGIWQFDGTFERLKNGKSRWRGKVRPMRVSYRFNGRKS